MQNAKIRIGTASGAVSSAKKFPPGVIMLEVKAGTDPEGDLFEKNQLLMGSNDWKPYSTISEVKIVGPAQLLTSICIRSQDFKIWERTDSVLFATMRFQLHTCVITIQKTLRTFF